ncbi:MAG: glycosyltransferase family 2 protein [Clostridia bacterium]|nr:glycosyltransferase family 2 protein [Clostridia bacterium]
MTEGVVLSVIIPVYNGGALLRETVTGFPRPSFPFEMLVVDDGSTDGTPAILAELAAADPVLRVIRQENAGPAAARNRGLKEARGAYILFCDADDAYLPGAPEKMVQTARETGADLLITGFLLTEERGASAPYTHRDLEGEDVGRAASSLYRANLLNQVWAKLFRRDLAEGLAFPDLFWGEDRIFLLEALCRARRPVVRGAPTYEYRQRGGSLISRFLPEKAEACRRADALFREAARKGRAPEEECRETADYMLVKSLWSCLTTLFSPTCPLSGREKKEYVRVLLRAEGGAERRYPADCGRAFKLLAKVWRTGRPGLVLATARAVALASRLAPGAARRAKHTYNKR